MKSQELPSELIRIGLDRREGGAGLCFLKGCRENGEWGIHTKRNAQHHSLVTHGFNLCEDHFIQVVGQIQSYKHGDKASSEGK